MLPKMYLVPAKREKEHHPYEGSRGQNQTKEADEDYL